MLELASPAFPPGTKLACRDLVFATEQKRSVVNIRMCMYGHTNEGGNLNIKTMTLGCQILFLTAAVITLIKWKRPSGHHSKVKQ